MIHEAMIQKLYVVYKKGKCRNLVDDITITTTGLVQHGIWRNRVIK